MNYLLIPCPHGLHRLAVWYTNERQVIWTWRRMLEKTKILWEREGWMH